MWPAGYIRVSSECQMMNAAIALTSCVRIPHPESSTYTKPIKVSDYLTNIRKVSASHFKSFNISMICAWVSGIHGEASEFAADFAGLSPSFHHFA